MVLNSEEFCLHPVSEKDVSILSIQGSGSKYKSVVREFNVYIKSQSFLFKAVVLNFIKINKVNNFGQMSQSFLFKAVVLNTYVIMLKCNEQGITIRSLNPFYSRQWF